MSQGNKVGAPDSPPDADTGVDDGWAATRNGQQLWVHGKLWNPRRVAGRIPVGILIDTGAAVDNYILLTFWSSVQTWGGSAGRRKLSLRGRGSLQAANPAGTKVPVMEIVGSTVMPIVLPPDDEARNILVRIVRDLPEDTKRARACTGVL